MAQISDESALAKIIDGIIEGNPDNVAKFRAGKVQLIGFFVGETMKATKGQANPQAVNRLLKEKLG